MLGILLFGSAIPLYAHLPVELALYLSLLFGTHLLTQRYPRVRPGRFVILGVTLVSVWMVYREFHTLFGYQAGIALLAVMLALKLLETRSERDLFLVVILGFFFLVAQFLLNQSMYMALYALLLVLGMLAVLVRHVCSAPTTMSYLFKLSGLLLVQAIPLVAIMFLLFPRLSTPLWDLKLGSVQGITGLSESMAPGSVNQLIKSREPAFRAEFFGPVPDTALLYWRGPVFWKTDGNRWFGREPGQQVVVGLDLKKFGKKDIYQYRLILEPHGKHWILALDLPARAPLDTRLTADFQLLSKKPVNQRRQFLLESVTSVPTNEITGDERTAALQLPTRVSARTQELVKEWQEHAGSQDEIVHFALNYFNKENFIYTLSPPPVSGDVTDQFLFETRSGFCEHYASAFSLLMRIGGVPSRVVTGYLGGEYNALGDYLIVRQSDAHAWSEVWLQDKGWMRVDPTAAIAPERIHQQILFEVEKSGLPVSYRLNESSLLGSVFRDVTHSLDALNTKWHIWVLAYDGGRQTRLLNWMGFNRANKYMMGVLMLMMLALFFIVLVYLMSRKQGSRIDPVTRLYNQFCRRLGLLGIVRGQCEGPQDFAARAAGLRPDLNADIMNISTLYAALRFSGRGSPRQFEQFKVNVRQFKPIKL